MGIVASASLITAFLAGTAALLAPCCIGVMLPAYLASVFKTKTKIYLMTFVYYLGLLTVFLPLGLGMASLGSLFSRYHGVFFTAGGLFMLALGIALILGKTVMLPMRVKPQLKQHDFGSIYVLGIFSGVATSCCAPVLAGVMALSILPGSLFLGSLYSVVFVTGMVVPLFLMAGLIDKTNLVERFMSLRRQVSYSLAGRQIEVNLSHLISGTLFIAIGAFILIFERRGPEVFSGSYQVGLNILAAQITRWVEKATSWLPQAGWAFVFVALIGLITFSAYRQARNASDNRKEQKR